uniref:G_PROTEIN_RECEP_F1_2 domain-containing protein n=1 Tax=Panagrellus redivivus TaxID=6233 RepID=A0A7E4V055_PANRE
MTGPIDTHPFTDYAIPHLFLFASGQPCLPSPYDLYTSFFAGDGDIIQSRAMSDANGHPSTNPFNLTSCPEEVFSSDQISYRLYGNMPISVLGIFANIINIIVFADSEMRTLLMNHFLLALSISDLLLLIFNFFFLLFPAIAINSNNFFAHSIYPAIVRISYPMALTTQTCGVYLTVLVSCHRFLGVCMPFRTKRWVTRRPVQYAIISSVIFSIAVNIPTWLELDTQYCFSKQFQQITTHITLTELQKSQSYNLVKKVIMYTLVMFVIPFTILIVVNWKIILALRASTNLRTLHTYSTRTLTEPVVPTAHDEQPHGGHEHVLKQFRLLKKTKYSEMFQSFAKMSNASIFKPSSDLFKKKFTNSLRDRSVTLMLLAIVALFLGCNGLAFCNNIVEILVFTDHISEDENSGSSKWFENTVELSNILITVNSSTSSLVYFVFSSKYRNIVKALFGLEQRKSFNRVAFTTALAAHRAVELSLIPDEASTRKRNQTIPDDRMSLNGKMFGCNAASRRKLFRSQTTLNRSLPTSESHHSSTSTLTLTRHNPHFFRLMETTEVEHP